MFRKLFCLVAFAAILCAPSTGLAGPVLGTAQDFAVLGGSAVTAAGPAGTVIVNGNVGSAPTATVTGFPPALLSNGTLYEAANQVTADAHTDLIAAYNALWGYGGVGTNMSGLNLGNRTLSPGVYSSHDVTTLLNGPLVLDAGGSDGAFWIFKLDTALTTGTTDGSSVTVIDLGPNNGSDVGVFWLVGSSATLGSSTAFEGNILAVTSITLDPSATILNGRALAQTGAVTLASFNTISNVCPFPNNGPGFSGGLEFDVNGELVPIPAPGAFLLVGMGTVLVGWFRRSRTV